VIYAAIDHRALLQASTHNVTLSIQKLSPHWHIAPRRPTRHRHRVSLLAIRSRCRTPAKDTTEEYPNKRTDTRLRSPWPENIHTFSRTAFVAFLL